MAITKNDYVILTTQHTEIPLKSVGLVKDLHQNKAKVFFYGVKKEVEIPVNEISVLDVKSTGKPHTFKICNVCHILKEDFTDFEVNQTDAKGRKTTRPSCDGILSPQS